jgi:hypothetical protein
MLESTVSVDTGVTGADVVSAGGGGVLGGGGGVIGAAFAGGDESLGGSCGSIGLVGSVFVGSGGSVGFAGDVRGGFGSGAGCASAAWWPCARAHTAHVESSVTVIGRMEVSFMTLIHRL